MPFLRLKVAAPIQEREAASMQSAGGGRPAVGTMEGVKAVLVKDRESSGIMERQGKTRTGRTS
jgi:hypothetical protein